MHCGGVYHLVKLKRNARRNIETSRIFNNYRFSTATLVTRTHLNVRLYVHCILVANRQTMTVMFNSCRVDQQELGTSGPRVAY